MRRAARVDKIHTDVVDTFRRLGCSVLSLAGMGGGVPDLLVANPHGSYLVEVKTGTNSPSRKKLTPDQVAFHSSWRGQIYIVESLDDVSTVIIKAARDIYKHG